MPVNAKCEKAALYLSSFKYSSGLSCETTACRIPKWNRGSQNVQKTCCCAELLFEVQGFSMRKLSLWVIVNKEIFPPRRAQVL